MIRLHLEPGIIVGWKPSRAHQYLDGERWRLAMNYPSGLPVPMVYLRDPLLWSIPFSLARRWKA